MQNWRLLRRDKPVENQWITIHRDRCETGTGEVVEDYFTVAKPDYVQMVAVTEGHDLLLVRQYKHGSGQVVTELPAGYVDGDEDPVVAARRELLEETGHDATEIRHLATLFTSPGVLTNRAVIFLCTGLRNTGRQHLDPLEEIEILKVPVSEVLQSSREAALLDDASSLAALFLALPHLDGGTPC